MGKFQNSGKVLSVLRGNWDDTQCKFWEIWEDTGKFLKSYEEILGKISEKDRSKLFGNSHK